MGSWSLRGLVGMAALCWATAVHAGTWPVFDGATAQGTWESTEAGVERLDLVVGTGEEAREGATVRVHYTGMLADGKVFDSSLKRGEHFAFRIGGRKVIRGWEDGVQGMRVGGKRRLIIPPELGYGNQGAGPIPPGSTLFFEIELFEVDAPATVPDRPTPVDDKAFRASRSGLVWADVQRGKGGKPKQGRRVCVAYAAWAADGTLVDHTRGKGECWIFRYGHDKVFDGLVEGLRTMKAGGVRQLRIPPDLLQGKGPNQALEADEPILFEVRLVDAMR